MTDVSLLNHILIRQMKFEPDGNVTSFGELTDVHILLYVKHLGASLVHFNLTQGFILILKLSWKDVVILHTERRLWSCDLLYSAWKKLYSLSENC